MVNLTLQTPNITNLPADLMDQIYYILDSKIQYQEFYINQAVKSYVDIEPAFPGEPTSKKGNPFSKILENNARVLETIDESSRIMKRLFFIRQRLTHENASEVLKRLTDGSLEKMTKDELKNFFDHPWKLGKTA